MHGRLALTSGQQLTIDLHSLDALLDEARDHGRYFFSIEVAAEATPIQAAMVHHDALLGEPGLGGGMLTLGSPLFEVTIAG